MCPYEEARTRQRELLERRINGQCSDTLVLVEHPPVFTIGRQGSRANILVSDAVLAEKAITVLEVERGGDITYHGPGQLVAYPIFQLPEGHRNVKAFIRNIEDAVARTCRHFGVQAVTIEGLTGVWVGADSPDGTHLSCWKGEKKLASIGLAFRKWISYHGVALNVCGDMTPFTYMHLCGLKGKQAISLAAAAGREIGLDEVKPIFIQQIQELWNAIQPE